MSSAPSSAELAGLRALALRFRPRLLSELRRLVDIDSGTFTKAGVDRVSGWMMRRLEALGATITTHPHAQFGDTRVATFERPEPGPTILLVGHADTVFDPGTARERPFSMSGGRAFGPGVADMKGGLLCGLEALAILRERAAGRHEWLPAGRVIFVVNPDEEIGSPTSTPIIQALSGGADAAFVLEGARPNGQIVSARAGMMHLRASVAGRAAHAGVEPERGHSAILEAAHLIVALSALTNSTAGVSVNVGEVHGGTRPNIVPASATMTVDVRTTSSAQQDETEAVIRGLLASTTVAGTTATVDVTARSRPMERTPASAELLELGTDVAAGLGFDLVEASSRGASDGNTTAGAGVPTLDGIGPVGGARHTPDEYIELESIAPRTAWLAAMLNEIGVRYAPGR